MSYFTYAVSKAVDAVTEGLPTPWFEIIFSIIGILLLIGIVSVLRYLVGRLRKNGRKKNEGENLEPVIEANHKTTGQGLLTPLLMATAFGVGGYFYLKMPTDSSRFPIQILVIELGVICVLFSILYLIFFFERIRD